MSQHDLDIANQLFPATRTDLNNALKALGSTSSGTSAPSTTYANQLWYDTANNKLYIRNEDNDANIEILVLDQSNDTVEYFKSDSIRTALIEFTDGDDAITINDGGSITTSGDATVTGNLALGGSNTELRFMEGSNYVGFEAPALSGNQIWVLPSSDGSADQFLKTNGSGTLSFGTLTGGATGGGSDTIFVENSRVMTTNYTLSTGKSASMVGTLTINSGVTLTIPSGERLVIL
tara:strand:- start:861 stop:1562 length:702 start_codon:yes stop_codon:yes gene_type:complete